MAFTDATFTGPKAGGRPLQLHTYITADTKAATIADNYFNGRVDDLAIGDVILATTDTGTTPATYALFVLTNDGTNVTTGYVGVA